MRLVKKNHIAFLQVQIRNPCKDMLMKYRRVSKKLLRVRLFLNYIALANFVQKSRLSAQLGQHNYSVCIGLHFSFSHIW